MNLDDLDLYKNHDSQNMLSHIDGLPDQLRDAWKLGTNLELPRWSGVKQVLIAGMGGSAIGADLLSAYLSSRCDLPIVVHRDYGLPTWVKGNGTLVITASHSGNTEETLSVFDIAMTRDCRILVITTGGALAHAASQSEVPVWEFVHNGQPRAAVGYSFGLLLAAMFRLDLVLDPTNEISGVIEAMKEQQKFIKAEIPVVQNPAKRLAGQLVDRWVNVFGAGILAPVARRWKGQISEIAKAWAQFEFLPEADHNTLAGILNPERLFSSQIALFLQCSSDHPRNHLRSHLTSKAFMVAGMNTSFVDARGDTPLAQLWTCLHFGDYMAYYLAMAYGVDPTPVASIEGFKREMAAAG